MVLCTDGLKCIPISELCDSFENCVDRSDEKNCVNGIKQYQLCPSNNKMIEMDKVCDGREHCPGGSDELKCRPCPENRVACTRHASLCIRQNQVCNSARNCPGATDEKNCSVCPYNMWKCKRKQSALNSQNFAMEFLIVVHICLLMNMDANFAK